MKVMGFDDLVLVAPRWPNVLRREETIQRASGAIDVLEKARVVDTLDEALEGISHLCATAMTPRDFGPPTRAPREHFATLAADPPAGVAFLFGSERFGMRNEDVYRCHVALSIPTAPGFGSLNLAAAVQGQDIQARLARWILLSQARTHQTELQLTHAHLADMLGVRRAGITLAARNLKDRGLVDYRRGRIQILNFEGLATVAHAQQGTRGDLLEDNELV